MVQVQYYGCPYLKRIEIYELSITSKSVSVPTTGFLSLCAKVSAVDMSVCARWWSPSPSGTLADCWYTIKCARPIHKQCSTTEVNRLLCLMAMTALHQQNQLINNAATV